MPNPVENLSYINATARVAPALLKALAILSNATVKRSTVDREDMKLYWKLEKIPDLSRSSIGVLFISFLKALPTYEKRLTGW